MPSSCLRAFCGAELALKKKASVSTRERKKDHTSRTQRTFCRRATNNKIVQNGKKAPPNASRRDRRSLGFCSLSFPAFSRAARGDLTLSFPRRFAGGKFESEIPRHDHDITTTRPFLLRREKKRGRLSSSTLKRRPRAFERRRSSKRVSKRAKSSSSSKPTVMALRDSKIPIMNFETKIERRRRRRRRRRRKLSRRTRSPVFLRDEHPLVLAVSVPLEHVREILDGFLRGLVEAQAAVRVRIDR